MLSEILGRRISEPRWVARKQAHPYLPADPRRFPPPSFLQTFAVSFWQVFGPIVFPGQCNSEVVQVGKARILLADDHTLVAEAIKRLLEPEFEVVAVVADGRSLVREAVALKPDVALVDLNMPILNGFDASEQLKASNPAIKIIVLTMNEDPEIAAETLRTWASGFLLKKSAGSELVKAVREVLHGGKYITPALQEVLGELSAREPRCPETGRVLTPRQREVLQLLAEGHTMKEAAAILNVATRTVAFHKYRIMQDFSLANNSELLRFAIKQRVIEQR
jgi:DNA-binding NarL/FixJ family response regulator